MNRFRVTRYFILWGCFVYHYWLAMLNPRHYIRVNRRVSRLWDDSVDVPTFEHALQDMEAGKW